MTRGENQNQPLDQARLHRHVGANYLLRIERGVKTLALIKLSLIKHTVNLHLTISRQVSYRQATVTNMCCSANAVLQTSYIHTVNWPIWRRNSWTVSSLSVPLAVHSN